MKHFSLKLHKRNQLGKKVKAVREAGQVPGVIYGKGVDSVSVSADAHEIEKIFQEAGYNHVIDLDVEGTLNHQALFKDVDWHPVTSHLRHFDFLAVKKGEKIRTEVPVELVGEAPGLISGRLVDQLVDIVEVETTPDKLPDHFEIDISGLAEVGDTIQLSSIIIPEDVTIHTELDQPAVRLEEEHEQVIEEPEVEAPAEGEEGVETETEATEGAETESSAAEDETAK